MLNMCTVCKRPVPGGVGLCPNCGADDRSWRRVLLQIAAGGSIYRVRETPFHGDRTWAKRHFDEIADATGNPVHKYFPREGPLFLVQEGPEGYVASSPIDPSAPCNRTLLDGAPLGPSPVPLPEGPVVLEIWSHSQGRPIARFELSLI
jgi:hypothetical protein